MYYLKLSERNHNSRVPTYSRHNVLNLDIPLIDASPASEVRSWAYVPFTKSAPIVIIVAEIFAADITAGEYAANRIVNLQEWLKRNREYSQKVNPDGEGIEEKVDVGGCEAREQRGPPKMNQEAVSAIVC